MSLTIIYSLGETLNWMDYLSHNLQFLKPLTKEFLFILPFNENIKQLHDILISEHIVSVDEDMWNSYLNKNNNDEQLTSKELYFKLTKKGSHHFLFNNEIISSLVNCHNNTKLNEIKNTITKNIESLCYYDSIITFNCDNIFLRNVDEIKYGSDHCKSIIGTNKSISTILNKFSIEGFVDYLNNNTTIEVQDSFIFETYSNNITIEFTLNDIKNNWNLFPFIKVNEYLNNIYHRKNKLAKLMSNIEPYNHIKKYEYKKLIDGYNMTSRYRNKKNKNLTIYCYYEKDGFKKNQTNLEHFIKSGLSIPNMDYIFIINGHRCSVNIPEKENITIIKEDNCYDFESWYNVLEVTEWYEYKYIFFMNCSVIGPLNFDNSNTVVIDWFTPFLEKMDENTVICSNIINKNGESRCTTYNFLLDTKVIPLLLTKRIFGDSKDKTRYYNTVFGRKIDKIDTTLTGEYGLSRVLLDAGFHITCLHPGLVDRNDGNHKRVEMTIFMKNNWNEDINRSSLPCGYHDSMRIIGKDIVKLPDDYDYNKLNCDDRGFYGSIKKGQWKSKKEFYDLFGYAEQIDI